MHWSVDVRILCDDFVSYLVPAKFHAGPNPHDIDAVRVRSPEKLICFTLWHFFLLHRVPVTLTRSILICKLVQVGRSRKVDIWNNVSKQRYVTIRDILVPFVTLRYEALRNRFSLGIFPWHMQKGLLQPLSPNATRMERWCNIFLCDNMVSYLIPAKFHTGATLLLHSCAVSSSVELARNFVNSEYHHASWPCVSIVYLQSRSFALALRPDFTT